LDPRSVNVLAQTEHSGPWTWVGLLVVVGAVYVIARVLTWLGMFVALYRWRRSREAHWSVRASLATSGRRTGKFAFFVIMVPLIFVVARGLRRIEFAPSIVGYFLVVVAGYIGVTQARLAWEAKLNPALVLNAQALRATWIFRVSVLGILVVAGFVLCGVVSYTEGPAAWAIVGLGVLSIGAYIWWGWVKLMKGLGIFRPAGARLLAVVEQAVRRLDVRPSAVYEVGLPITNALAYPGSNSIGFSDGALTALSDDELVAVCAHELAHLAERRWVRAVRFANSFVVGGLVAAPAAVMVSMRNPFGGTELVIGLAVYVIVLVHLIAFVRLYRRMELRADALACAAEPAPGVYARALEKIYEANLVPLVISSQAHRYPELYDRLVDAGAPPSYPRPAAPPRWPGQVGTLIVLTGTIAACFVIDWLFAVVASRS
jgi:Zn-dependent protease with chaperone function